MTVSWAEIEAALQNVRYMMDESKQKTSRARGTGAHAEGPFINPKRKGAQSEEAIIPGRR